jgi:hypothetical protein
LNLTQTLTISNVGAAGDTFQISTAPRDPSAPVPQFPTTSVQLDPGASVSIPIVFPADGLSSGQLSPGQYEGFIQIQGANAPVPTQVPYWFGVASGTPAYITVLNLAASASAGSTLTQAVIFRLTDSVGLPASANVSISAISGGGRVNGISPLGGAYPNDYVISLRLGAQPGTNVFQIQAGSLVSTVTITGQ